MPKSRSGQGFPKKNVLQTVRLMLTFYSHVGGIDRGNQAHSATTSRARTARIALLLRPGLCLLQESEGSARGAQEDKFSIRGREVPVASQPRSLPRNQKTGHLPVSFVQRLPLILLRDYTLHMRWCNGRRIPGLRQDLPFGGIPQSRANRVPSPFRTNALGRTPYGRIRQIIRNHRGAAVLGSSHPLLHS